MKAVPFLDGQLTISPAEPQKKKTYAEFKDV